MKSPGLFSSQSGQVFVYALLPLLLSCTIVGVSASLITTEWSRTHHHCRDNLLQAQEILLIASNQLIAMNPKAQALRQERRRAEKAVLEAPDPYSKAAATAWLTSVIARQLSFRSQQMQMKAKALTKAQMQVANIRKEFLQKEKGFQVHHPSLQLPKAKLDLKMTPLWSLTPNFERYYDHEVRQTMTARWQLPIQEILPHWILPFLPSMSLKNTCSATHKKRSYLWFSALTKAKS